MTAQLDYSLAEVDELARQLAGRHPRALTLLRKYFPQIDVDAAYSPAQLNAASTVNTHGLMTPWSDGCALVGKSATIFAIGSSKEPSLRVDDTEVSMTHIDGTCYWTTLKKLAAGQTHAYEFTVDNRSLGVGDVAGYLAESWPAAGARRGTMAGPFVVQSARIYPGATTEFWIYANPGVDPAVPSPLMVWLDGENFVGLKDVGNQRLQVVSDNLVASADIPPLVHVLVSSSKGGELPRAQYADQDPGALMRSVQFDTVSDRYGRHLLDEVLPVVAEKYALRGDGYSRAVAGGSSGGVASFTLAWFHNDHFTRVGSWIGSFTGLQWAPGQSTPGGQDYATLVRRERRNIRVWLSDGENDVNVDHNGRSDIAGAGSWPINNIQLANSLKLFGYDMHFEYGTAGHNMAQSSLDLPKTLRWLWRDYNPDRTGETFEQDPSERDTPAWSVRIGRS